MSTSVSFRWPAILIARRAFVARPGLIAIFAASLVLIGNSRTTAHRAKAAIVHGRTFWTRSAETGPHVTIKSSASSPGRRAKGRAACLRAKPPLHRADIRAWAESLTIAELRAAGRTQIEGPVAVRANLRAGAELARAGLWTIPRRTALCAETLPRSEAALRSVEGRTLPAHLRTGERVTGFLAFLVGTLHFFLLGAPVLFADFLAVLAGGRAFELAGLIALRLAQSAERRNAERECQQEGGSFHGVVPFFWCSAVVVETLLALARAPVTNREGESRGAVGPACALCCHTPQQT